MVKQNTYLASKPRYEILDGLRGVAALMVIFFHCFETYIPKFGTQIINHGYLAVDFFFLLSGFVIGYAYDDRWDKMTTWGFFKRRLVRLQPMVIMGTVIGACLFFFGECAGFPNIANCKGWMFGLCIVMGILMIPTGPGLDIRGWGETNSLNGPNWSLTFEYIGNILYALVFRRLSKIALAIFVIGCAFFTLDLTLGWDVFNFFDAPKYNVIGGWSLTGPQLYIGFTRLLYPFLCGLLISRILTSRISESNPTGSPLNIRGGFWWSSLLLIVLLSLPLITGREGVADGLYQAILILAIFPIIVLIGAGSKTTDAKSTKICKFFGDISYPLYITHYPFMYMQMAWVAKHPEAPVWMHIMLNIGVVLVSLATAWASLKLYDEPVRKWLTENWLKKVKR
jgi:peptidoglycan/LPS O-acetylase OafA/YrhL